MGNVVVSHYALMLKRADDFDVTGKLIPVKLLHGVLFGAVFVEPYSNSFRKYVLATSNDRNSEDISGFFAFPVAKDYLDYFDFDYDGGRVSYDNYFAATTKGILRLRYIPKFGKDVMTIEYSGRIGEELVIDPVHSIDYARSNQKEFLRYQGGNRVKIKSGKYY